MKRITIATLFIALAALTTVGLLLGAGQYQVQAQDQQPSPVPDRISFGLVGITHGQTIRLSAANTTIPNDLNFPPGPTRVSLTFLDAEGRPFRSHDGSVVRRVVDLQRGQSTFLDLNYDELPPGPSRLQLRAVLTVLPPGPTKSDTPPPIGDRIVPSVEVINNGNARTVLFVGNPGVIHGFNPQPDPPLDR